MNNQCASNTKAYGYAEIGKALSAYHEEFCMVSSLNGNSLYKPNVSVRLQYYPFTKVTMPYASINLINLAIEQAMIVMFDRIVLEGAVEGPWSGIEEYRSLVSEGCWLVPKLDTKVVSPVPLNEDILLNIAVNQIHTGKRRVMLSFSVNCPDHISSSGLAIFEKREAFRRRLHL